jgi:hypothetical protein
VPSALPNAVFSYPNPSTSGQPLTFVFSPSQGASLLFYDWSGRKVFELPAGAVKAAAGIARWDGKGPSGQGLPSGPYFVVVRIDSGAIRGKFTVLKP